MIWTYALVRELAIYKRYTGMMSTWKSQSKHRLEPLPLMMSYLKANSIQAIKKLTILKSHPCGHIKALIKDLILEIFKSREDIVNIIFFSKKRKEILCGTRSQTHFLRLFPIWLNDIVSFSCGQYIQDMH